MKTTVDIADALLARAKRHAQKTGKPLGAVIEEGLRRVLGDETELSPYRLPDRAIGDSASPDPLEGLSWQGLRDKIYGDPGG